MGLKPEEVADAKAAFAAIDKNNDGHLSAGEINQLFKNLNESVPGFKVREMIAEVDTSGNGMVELEEFITMLGKVRENKTKYGLADGAKNAKVVKEIGGTSDASAHGTKHSFSSEETASFANWINIVLQKDSELSGVLPLNEDGDHLFRAVADGLLLCKLINSAVKDTVDERAINKKKLNVYTIHENQTLVLNSASAIGCNITNIGAQDLIDGKPHLVLGLVWQIIRIGLLSKISIKENPNLTALLRDGESLSDLLKLSPEQLLIRWVNYQMEQAGCARRINNFSKDINDSEVYTYLIHQIAPEGSGVSLAPLTAGGDLDKAASMLTEADKIECKTFVRPADVVSGHPKLNLAFVANLFNTYPALEAKDDGLGDIDLGDMAETREEKTFRNFMNSLGVNPFVNNLYEDLRDAIVLLQILDKIKPGVVEWSKVNMPPFKAMGAQMKAIENCNYLVTVAKEMKFSLVGIGGTDINAGNKTLTLALVWQMLRAYTISVLQSLSGDGKAVSDNDIVAWVNDTLSGKGKTSTIASFKDQGISSSMPVLDIVDCIKPGSPNYELVHTSPADDEEKMMNAKYAISMCRKIGARTYALPEDLVEVKPKMVMTVFACLMSRSYAKK